MDYQVKVCQKQKKNVLHGRNSPKIPKESIIIKKINYLCKVAIYNKKNKSSYLQQTNYKHMKNRLLHLLGKVLLLSLLATACHKETAQPDPAPDKLNYELYENVCTDLSTYVKTYEEKEYDALIRYAEAIPGVDSTQVIDSILYVYTQGGYEWFYDMYGLSVAAPADYSIDPAQLQAELDSLRIAWGIR